MFTYLKLADSLIAQATLTPTTEDADFPIENAQVEPVSKIYRSTDDTAEKILVDFASAVAADIFAIVNHNFTSQATITLKGGSSSDPDGSQFQTTIDSYRRTAWKAFSQQTWQHWSLTVDDQTNPAQVIEMGLFPLMGLKTQLSRNFDLGWEKRRETLNQVLQSEYGVISTGQNLFQRSRFVGSWKTSNVTERNELDDFLLGLEKERTGMLFIPEPNEPEAFYGRFMTDYSLVRTSPDIAVVSGLEFLEDSPGRSIFA